VSNRTISGNSTIPGTGGGIYNNGEFNSTSTHIGNTILKTGASGENIVNSSGAVTSDGYNLSSDNAGGLLTACTPGRALQCGSYVRFHLMF
jgi:hypothetical protein